jgi:uncharacterized protein (DUF1015 family)
VTDQHTVSQVTGVMGPKPIFIADGHHRYETAVRYLDERREAGDVRDLEAAPNFVFMMLVSMSDPGLAILPTHRLVSGFAGLKSADLDRILQDHFEVEIVGRGETAARDAWDLIQAEGSQAVLGMGTVADDTWQIVRFRKPESMTVLAGQHSPAWQSLAVSILHVLALGKLLPEQSGGTPECRYVHLLQEVTDAARARTCDLAVLVPPVSMEHVAEIAENLEKMPPKSTYFYPKLLSGLVFNSLRSN